LMKAPFAPPNRLSIIRGNEDHAKPQSRWRGRRHLWAFAIPMLNRQLPSSCSATLLKAVRRPAAPPPSISTGPACARSRPQPWAIFCRRSSCMHWPDRRTPARLGTLLPSLLVQVGTITALFCSSPSLSRSLPRWGPRGFGRSSPSSDHRDRPPTHSTSSDNRRPQCRRLPLSAPRHFLVARLSIGQWFVPGRPRLLLGACGFLCFNFSPRLDLQCSTAAALVIGLLRAGLTVPTTYFPPARAGPRGGTKSSRPAIVLAVPPL